MVKRDRGRANHTNVDQAEVYWRDMNIDKVEGKSILPLAERPRPTLNRRLDDPVLQKLRQHACEKHRAKIADLQAMEDWEPFRKWLYENKLLVE